MKLLYILAVFMTIVSSFACQSQADHIHELIGQLGSDNYHMQSEAIDNLVNIGSPAVKPLIDALNSSDKRIRQGAAAALGEIKDERSIGALTYVLGDSDEKVRLRAEDALVGFGQGITNVLITILQNGSTPARRSAAQALGRINDPAAVAPLMYALHDNDIHLRLAATDALGKLKDSRSVPALIDLLDDRDELVRTAAIDALIAAGEAAVEPLIAALKNDTVLLTEQKYVEVRQGAAMALGKIKDLRALAPLIASLTDKDQSYVEVVRSALIDFGAPAADQLLILVNGTDTRLACEAIFILGQIKDERAIEPLISIIQNKEVGTERCAFEALRSMGDIASARVDTILSDALKEKDLRIISACFDYYIIRGQDGTETILINAMNQYSNYRMASVFLNCGNEKLQAAAIGWGEGHSFTIIDGMCMDLDAIASEKMRETGHPNRYCNGIYSPLWGNKPSKLEHAYSFWRGVNSY